MSILKTNNAPIARKTKFELENGGVPELTKDDIVRLGTQSNETAFLSDLGIRISGYENRISPIKTSKGKSFPRMFCMEQDEKGHDVMREMTNISIDAAFWKQVQSGNVFLYAAGENQPRQLQVQRGEQGLQVAVSDTIEPNAMPELNPPKPNWFKRTFSFFSKKWKQEVEEYNKVTSARPHDRADRIAKLSEIAEARSDAELKEEAETAKEDNVLENVCRVSYKDTFQMERGIETMTSVFQPVPQFKEKYEKIEGNPEAGIKGKYGLYTKKQFADLKVFSKEEFDLESIHVGEGKSPVSVEDFSAVTLAALWTPELGAKGDNETDIHATKSLMEVGGVTKEEAEKLAISNISSSFWTTDLFIDPPRDNEGSFFKQVTNDGRQMAVDAFNAYKDGNKEPLARLLALGVNKAVTEFNHEERDGKLTYDEIAMCTMVPKMAAMMEKDPELKDLAIKNHGLTENRLKAVKGMETLMKMEQDRRKAAYQLDREATVGDQHLTTEQKAQLAKASIKIKLMRSMISEEVDQNTKSDKRLSDIQKKLMDGTKMIVPSNDQQAAWKKDPSSRPEPAKGTIYLMTASKAAININKALGKDLKLMPQLGGDLESRLDLLAEGIVQKHDLGSKSAEYLSKELSPKGFDHIRVLEDAKEITDRLNPAKDVQKTEPEKAQNKELETANKSVDKSVDKGADLGAGF